MSVGNKTPIYNLVCWKISDVSVYTVVFLTFQVNYNFTNYVFVEFLFVISLNKAKIFCKALVNINSNQLCLEGIY